MTLDLYAAAHDAFCRTPLHPGPCKGWKGTVRSTSKAIRERQAQGVKSNPIVQPVANIGKPSRTGRADLAVSPEKMEQEWEGHWNKMTPTQKTAAYRYSGYDYGKMNAVLRDPGSIAGDQDAFDAALMSRELQSAMAPAPRGTKAFRGLYSRGLGISDNPTLEEMQALVGDTLINDAFTSTTVNRDLSFAGNVRMDIEVPKGTPSLWMGKNSSVPSEAELLLAAGAKMKILGVEPYPGQAGSYIVKARIVP